MAKVVRASLTRNPAGPFNYMHDTFEPIFSPFSRQAETIYPSPTSSSEDRCEPAVSVSVQLDFGEGRGTHKKRETNEQKNKVPMTGVEGGGSLKSVLAES